MSEESMKQHAPILYEDLKWKDCTEWPKFNESLFIFNVLILAGTITAIALILEVLLRWYERQARQPARIAITALHYSDLRFSLLTLFITSVTVAALLAASVRPILKEQYVVQNLILSNSRESLVEIVRTSSEQRGWPIVYAERNQESMFPIKLPVNSAEAEEASGMKIGPILPQVFQQTNPHLFNEIRSRNSRDDFPGVTIIDIRLLLLNLLANVAITLTFAVLAELLQRRRKKPTNASPSQPTFTSA